MLVSVNVVWCFSGPKSLGSSDFFGSAGFRVFVMGSGCQAFRNSGLWGFRSDWDPQVHCSFAAFFGV